MRNGLKKSPTQGHTIVKFQDTRLEKILEATGIMGEAEESHILRTSNKKGFRCLSSSLESWRDARILRRKKKKKKASNSDQAK